MRSTDADAFLPLRAPPPLDRETVHVWIHDTGETRPRAVRDAARAMLDRLLAGYAGDERAPVVEAGAHGKPFAPALPWLDFNLSHAGSFVAIAFARGQPLGIDIEPLDRRVAVDGVAARFFGAAETAALERIGADARQPAFLRLWTHKEAVLKALGDGLGFGLDRIEFDLSGDGRVARLARLAVEAGRPADWQLRPFEPVHGVVGCLAWRGAARAVRPLRLVS
jgi:4'-phosphopantetheinyl transferase